MAKTKHDPETYDLPTQLHEVPPDESPPAEPKKREKRKPPVTQQEIFDEETRIVRGVLKRVAVLPEKARMRVLNRLYELREFPLIDVPKE